MFGGVAALAGAIVLGPRIGKYSRDGKSNPIPGNHLPLALLGVFILAFGWFGFNAGSTLAAPGVAIRLPEPASSPCCNSSQLRPC